MSKGQIMQHFYKLRQNADAVFDELRKEQPISISKVDGGVQLIIGGTETKLPSSSMAYVVARARQEKLPIVQAIDRAAAFRRDRKPTKMGSTSALAVDQTIFVPREFGDFVPLVGELLDDTDFTLEELQEMYLEAFESDESSVFQDAFDKAYKGVLDEFEEYNDG